MQQAVLKFLAGKRVILASGSPRRVSLLSETGLCFETIPSNYDELESPKNYPTRADFAIDMAYRKAMDVANGLEADLIIGADTIVVHNDEVFGKPKSDDHGKEILRRLSGQTHEVYTGVALIWVGSLPDRFYTMTKVKMHDLREDTISDYIKSGESRGKAGAYAIQDRGGLLVEKLDGDLNNVIGFPVDDFYYRVFQHYTNMSGGTTASAAKTEKEEVKSGKIEGNRVDSSSTP